MKIQPTEKKYGMQTTLALNNFFTTPQTISSSLIEKLVLIKMCYAQVNNKFNKLNTHKSKKIINACKAIIKNDLTNDKNYFPLSIWQSGSGTQTNMNVNEVIANYIKQHYDCLVHPNNDVNMGQSTNDVFPTAIQLDTTIQVKKQLLPAVELYLNALLHLATKYKKTIKIGRTHMQDALPITMEQYFASYSQQIYQIKDLIKVANYKLHLLPIGGTAVGSGINTSPAITTEVIKALNFNLNEKYFNAPNKLALVSGPSLLANLCGVINSLGAHLNKLANDLIIMSSGPDTGFNEIILPANEPGSSIMPGKVNPSQCEMLRMAVLYTKSMMDGTINATGLGQLELNTYQPLIHYFMSTGINILSQAFTSFVNKCLIKIKINQNKLQSNCEKSLMLITCLSPQIGYDQAAKVVQYCQKNAVNLKQACLKLNIMSEAEYDQIINLNKIANGNNEK